MKARYRKVHLLQEENLYEDAIELAKELAQEDPNQFSGLVGSAQKAFQVYKDKKALEPDEKSDEESDEEEEEKEA